jgi:hypothetical protein
VRRSDETQGCLKGNSAEDPRVGQTINQTIDGLARGTSRSYSSLVLPGVVKEEQVSFDHLFIRTKCLCSFPITTNSSPHTIKFLPRSLSVGLNGPSATLLEDRLPRDTPIAQRRAAISIVTSIRNVIGDRTGEDKDLPVVPDPSEEPETGRQWHSALGLKLGTWMRAHAPLDDLGLREWNDRLFRELSLSLARARSPLLSGHETRETRDAKERESGSQHSVWRLADSGQAQCIHSEPYNIAPHGETVLLYVLSHRALQ